MDSKDQQEMFVPDTQATQDGPSQAEHAAMQGGLEAQVCRGYAQYKLNHNISGGG